MIFEKYCVVLKYKKVTNCYVKDTKEEALALAYDIKESWDANYNTPMILFVRPCSVTAKIKALDCPNAYKRGK